MATSSSVTNPPDPTDRNGPHLRARRKHSRYWIALAGVALIPLLLFIPTVTATFVMTPRFNQGCNGNPHGTLLQFPPIGTTTHVLFGPTLTGGYLNPGVSGNQTASSVGATSSAILSSEYFMVGPKANTSVPTCWVPTVNKVVSATFKWQVNWTAYLAAACTGAASAVSSYQLYIVGNLHINHAPWYLITPVSPFTTVGAMVNGCGGPYISGPLSGVFSVTTPNVAVTAGTPYDFYSAIWAYTQVQTNVPLNSTGSAYAAVNWNASFLSATCNGC